MQIKLLEGTLLCTNCIWQNIQSNDLGRDEQDLICRTFSFRFPTTDWFEYFASKILLTTQSDLGLGTMYRDLI